MRTVSVLRDDDLHVLAAHVEEGRVHDLAIPELPDLGVGHGDEVLRLDHEVGHPRAGHQLDAPLDAVVLGEDGDLGFVGIRHNLAPGIVAGTTLCHGEAGTQPCLRNGSWLLCLSDLRGDARHGWPRADRFNGGASGRVPVARRLPRQERRRSSPLPSYHTAPRAVTAQSASTLPWRTQTNLS